MPKLAIISDIHGNIDALTAVLEDIDSQKADEIICLGDTVGYGAAPAECVALLRERCAHVVMGNHDSMASSSSEILASNKVMAGIVLARQQLSAEQMRWLESLPYVVKAHGITFVHASMECPKEFLYLFYDSDFQGHFHFLATHLSFSGHTHTPVAVVQEGSSVSFITLTSAPLHVSNIGCKTAIDIGSVGQPRDGIPLACYGMFDTDKSDFQLRRVEYDIAKAQARMRALGLPEENAARLATGK